MISVLRLKKLSRPGRYAVGNGAYLQIARGGSRSWLFRYRFDGKPHQMGLGSIKTWTLAEVRERARKLRQLLDDGIDPLARKADQLSKARLEVARTVTFQHCAVNYIDAYAPTWKNKSHRKQWAATLVTYAFPIFGDLSVDAVDTGLVLKALEPIWSAKPETASRVRNRVELVLDWAKARGYRGGENPARWRGHLDKLLPSHRKVARAEGRNLVRHLPALPYAKIGDFMAMLRNQEGIEARALEFTILTAARTNETRFARWDEIDDGSKTWTLPPSRMKGGREHRVPLPARAIEILESLPRQGEYIFPGFQPGKPLNHQAMLDRLKRMRSDVTVHGFRSTFKDWASEQTAYPSELSEMALAHAIGDRTEAAYRRGDLIEKRRRLMDDWAEYCAKTSWQDNVMPIRAP